MNGRLFGTDGVRGRFGEPPMDPATVRRLAAGAADALRPQGASQPLVLVGRDTRVSGPVLEQAVADGFLARGWDVARLGVVPTPAVSLAVRERGADLGVVLTASHNPAADNGVKFFAAGGRKLTVAEEDAVEAALPRPDWVAVPVPGTGCRPLDAETAYVGRASALLPPAALTGWRIVVDTANGATWRTTPAVLRALGAEIVPLGDRPDGVNINAGVGSEHPEALAAKVRETGARLGIAHDGDGDRLVLCDEHGVVLDGDEILTFLAVRALRRGELPGGLLVVTVQSNLGVDAAVAAAGGRVERTAVGDRHVAEALARLGGALGGESSGHLIFPAVSPTGDGLVAALQVLRVMGESGEPLSRLRRALARFPQRTATVRVREKRPLERCPSLRKVGAAAEANLGSRGRLLVRYSGTEPLLRLLVEGPDDATVARWIAALEEAARRDLGE